MKFDEISVQNSGRTEKLPIEVGVPPKKEEISREFMIFEDISRNCGDLKRLQKIKS